MKSKVNIILEFDVETADADDFELLHKATMLYLIQRGIPKNNLVALSYKNKSDFQLALHTAEQFHKYLETERKLLAAAEVAANNHNIFIPQDLRDL